MRVGAWTAALLAALLVAAAATWSLGWWSTPAAAALITALWRRTPHVVWAVTLGAVLAWGGILALDATGTGMRMLGLELAGTIGLPLPALVLATLAFPIALAWGAAVLTATLADALAPSTTR